MLQLWRKLTLTLIAITPESITVNSVGKASLVIDTKKASSWSHVLTELESNAASISAKAVRFIISNHYVRYAVLPWQAGVFSQQDWQSLAENYMRIMYGANADNWTVRVAMQGYGNPLIISAIDQTLLMRLESLAQQNKWVVESVEPALMSITNYYRNKISKNDWLMICEAQYLLLMERIKGVWVTSSVMMPPESDMEPQALSLVGRALKRQENSKLKQLHIFGNLSFSLDDDTLKINNLSENQQDSSTVSSILAGLT